ncbi:MAG: uroporphyrinogen-III C-methyltransferase [Archaeoglobi archaeon]|jgi:uroporphyrin-III C-methyltransferase|nr:uroporphyrinogen-III C-methyltransferase [Archaeoglobi archaeon]TDA29993.1 MAG: uroporphyrinogen-III C-methyltransferase [Archaeoglobi archaeon]
MVGKVYIVGAGPGKVDLLTLRALEVIKKADVILYDELIGEVTELLKETKAELISVGKRRGAHKFEQEEINRMMVELARSGKIVVRLKGGDPFVFGRGGEEAEFLAKEGVNFEYIPGISSAIAVPGNAGIPITYRGYDPAVVFITGQESRERLNWGALAKLNATIVVLMGLSNIDGICRNLVENGKDPETPVAVIEKGFSREERVVVGTLRDIVDKVKKQSITAPAIIVIGKVVELREILQKYQSR